MQVDRVNETVRQHEEPAASAPPRKRGRAIVVTSGKGGVGKTTTTANLGAALGATGASVVLVDADVGLRNLDIVLGLEARVRHHVLDVLEGVSTLDDALVTDKRVPSLKLLAAAQTREKDDVDTEAFSALIASLRERFDYVLIDCPAGIEKGFTNAIVGADEAIVVCTPEVSAVRDADRVVGLLGDDRSVKLIVNRLRPSLVKRGKMLSVDDVNGILRLPLLGVIADAPDVIVSTNRGEPVALDPASPIGAAYRAIAGRIDGTDSSAPEIPREKSFLEKLFGSKR
jgi:septum site-determining protein MinD